MHDRTGDLQSPWRDDTHGFYALEPIRRRVAGVVAHLTPHADPADPGRPPALAKANEGTTGIRDMAHSCLAALGVAAGNLG